MDQQPIRYAALRDRHRWDSVVFSGLNAEKDGALSLATLPGPTDGKMITIAGAFDSDPSGLAIGPCHDVVLADTANHRVLWQDGVCSERMLQLGNGAGNALSEFHTPCSLLIHADSLYVSDSGNARVQVFRLPTFEPRAILVGMFQQPTGLAADSKGRISVLDRGLKRITRFTAARTLDEAYNLAMEHPTNLTEPAFLALDGLDRLYVSDAQANHVVRFQSDGTPLGALLPASVSMRPRALAAQGERLYIADADSGQICVFDVVSNMYLGSIPGYRGPVSAMALDSDNSLWIKPGNDRVHYRLEPRKVFVAEGSLTTKEPLDAGEEADWARVHVDAEVPPGTLVQLHLIARKGSATPPSEDDWKKADALPIDTLVTRLPGLKDTKAGEKRFLWIRVVVTTEKNGTNSPRLFQIEAKTTSPSYLDYLPTVYRREDVPTRFLERWLQLVQGEVDNWESALEGMPRRFDPLTTPEDQLSWLAQWLAFPLPAGSDTDRQRAIFADIPRWYARRGTLAGIGDLAEIYTGVRPRLFEAFHTRRIWQLGEGSVLGLETALPPALPDGMVVPGWSVADPGLLGLRGDYYQGIHFDTLKATRRDAQVNFNWFTGSPMDGVLDSNNFSVRWTGQVQPRHSDLYTFHTVSDDGVCLWVDGRLIIDNWTDHPPSENQGRIALNAGRWYAITLEYYEKTGGATITLSWSSRNQRKEIIPQKRLYAVRDEHATLEGPVGSSDSCPVLVGQTVVGESQPLGAAEYGAPLYSESAHLFTVSVPAALLPTAAQRDALRDVIEHEKPAHTDYHLCFVEPRMRVGFQARIGIDSIVAGPPAPMTLTGTLLGQDSYLGDDDTGGRFGRVGSHAHVGVSTVIG